MITSNNCRMRVKSTAFCSLHFYLPSPTRPGRATPEGATAPRQQTHIRRRASTHHGVLLYVESGRPPPASPSRYRRALSSTPRATGARPARARGTVGGPNGSRRRRDTIGNPSFPHVVHWDHRRPSSGAGRSSALSSCRGSHWRCLLY